jgi:hypothetical protein
MKESKIAMAIHSIWEETEYKKHSYTPDEIKIIACDLKANVPIKRIARLRGPDFNRKGDGLIKKIRQIKRSLEKGFTVEEILNKKTTESYNQKLKDMSGLNFYSTEETVIMKTEVATGEPITQIAKRLSIKFNRNIKALEQKLYSIKRTVDVIDNWKVPKSKNSQIDKPIVNQQPAEVGIEVPHGMTFEGTPKKIMLHSDHFRIYF